MVAAQRMCKRCGNVPPIDSESSAPLQKLLRSRNCGKRWVNPRGLSTTAGPNTKARKTATPTSLVIAKGGRGMTTPSRT